MCRIWAINIWSAAPMAVVHALERYQFIRDSSAFQRSLSTASQVRLDARYMLLELYHRIEPNV